MVCVTEQGSSPFFFILLLRLGKVCGVRTVFFQAFAILECVFDLCGKFNNLTPSFNLISFLKFQETEAKRIFR